MQTKMPPVALKRFFNAGQVENLKSVMDFFIFYCRTFWKSTVFFGRNLHLYVPERKPCKLIHFSASSAQVFAFHKHKLIGFPQALISSPSSTVIQTRRTSDKE